jgi:hypothetical protein
MVGAAEGLGLCRLAGHDLLHSFLRRCAHNPLGLRRNQPAGFYTSGPLQIAICAPDCDRGRVLVPEQIVTPVSGPSAFLLADRISA